MSHLGDANVIRYGVPLRLRHVKTGHYLNTHEVYYTTGSKQHEVTCNGFQSESHWWIIKGRHSTSRYNQLIGTPVLNHSTIRLENMYYRWNLHSHANISPSSNQREVTCYGTLGIGDDNDNWKLILANGPENDQEEEQLWRVENQIRLIHINTQFALHSHSRHYTRSHQQEVTCFSGRDDNDLWQVEVEG